MQNFIKITSVVNYLHRIALLRSPNCGSARDGFLTGLPFFLLLVVVLSPCDGFAQGEPEEDGGPLLFSVFPTMGRQGSTVKAEARGIRLDGAYTVWFDGGGFKGRILDVEEVKDPVKQRVNPLEKLKITGPFYRTMIELQIEAKTHTGVYLLRLVSGRGVSNPIGFSVVDAPVTVEGPGPHQTMEQSQPVALPGLISGKIGEPGEVDTYSFHARIGQELRFEAVEVQKFDAAATAGKFAPELALCRAGGSWFDPHRPVRLLFEEAGLFRPHAPECRGNLPILRRWPVLPADFWSLRPGMRGLYLSGSSRFPRSGLLDGSLGTSRRFPNGQRGVLAGAWQRIG